MYFLNFIEEGILNTAFAGCVGGRVEVENYLATWPIMELRFLTRKRDQFEKFRDRWDGETVDRQTLGRIAVELRMVFQDGIKPLD